MVPESCDQHETEFLTCDRCDAVVDKPPPGDNGGDDEEGGCGGGCIAAIVIAVTFTLGLVVGAVYNFAQAGPRGPQGFEMV